MVLIGACTAAPAPSGGSTGVFPLQFDAVAAADGGLLDAADASGQGDAAPRAALDAARDPTDAAAASAGDTAEPDATAATLADAETGNADAETGNADATRAADMATVVDGAPASPDAASLADTAPDASDGDAGDVGSASGDSDAGKGDGASPPLDASVAAGDAVAADGADAAPWAPPAGGAPGSGCPGKEGQTACSADGKLRVECINGAWTGLQHCGFGLCSATFSAGGGILTTCGMPPAKLVALNAACARYLKCFAPAASHEHCVHANVYPGPFLQGAANGEPRKVVDLALSELHGVAACAAAAKTCGALAECLYYFAAPKCVGPQKSGCDGDLAWACGTDAKALAVNCKGYGMQCAAIGGDAVCLAPAACAAAAPVACSGAQAKLCTAVGPAVLGQIRDCGPTGKACVAGAASLAQACAGAVVTPCAAKEFLASCAAGKAVNCLASATTTTTCPPATACALEDGFGLLHPACPDGQACTVARCTEGVPCTSVAKCTGSEVWFCEAKAPAAFDCKAVGMTCGMAATGPRCQ
ncbi:MAG: hypothetical protein EXR79_07770 [Myxococcales bacterium]|nr:hypothetical protein [Myxococcales bacterium]